MFVAALGHPEAAPEKNPRPDRTANGANETPPAESLRHAPYSAQPRPGATARQLLMSAIAGGF
jgi:hypothetical protein